MAKAGSQPTAPIFVTLVVTAVLAAAGGGALAVRAHLRHRQIDRSSSRIAAELGDALERLPRQVADQAARAADVRGLRAAVDHGVDDLTMKDLLVSEAWWKPFRDGLSLVTRGGRVWAACGAGAEKLLDATLLTQAQQHQPATQWLMAPGPTVVAAVAVPARKRGDVVVVLGRPLDQPTLEPLATRLRAALLVSDGASAGTVVGLRPGKTLLGACVGHERDGPRVAPDGRELAIAVTVAPGWWIWAATEIDVGVATPVWLTFVLLALAAAAGLGSPLVGRAPTRRRLRASAASAPRSSSTGKGSTLARGTPARASAPALDSGHIFGRYIIIDRIGEGGMADLFTAVLTGAEGFQRLYVIKRLKPEFAAHRAAVEQFIDEAKVGSVLVHSNIVPVFDFGKVGSGFYLAQEYITGRNITELCQRHQERVGRPLDIPVVCYLVHEVLDALAYAHERVDGQGRPLHLVHRDVSTGNIMITAQGEVKLLDFGIVHAARRVASTDFGLVKGNPSFMAPEQARGLPVDGRTDLFSLGMVMFFALTGQPLYVAPTTSQALYEASTGPTADHLARIRALPAPLAALLERALALDPGDRYPTARDFAHALAPHIGGGENQLSTLMSELFGEELRQQTAVFHAKIVSRPALDAR